MYNECYACISQWMESKNYLFVSSFFSKKKKWIYISEKNEYFNIFENRLDELSWKEFPLWNDWEFLLSSKIFVNLEQSSIAKP